MATTTQRDFNGSTLLFNSVTIGRIKSMKRSAKCKDIDVTSLDESVHVSAAGKSKESLTCTIIGTPTALEGSHGAMTVTWGDGTTMGSVDYAVCLSVDGPDGSLDGEMTSTYEFTKHHHVT